MTQKNDENDNMPADTRAYLEHMKKNMAEYTKYNSNLFFTYLYNQTYETAEECYLASVAARTKQNEKKAKKEENEKKVKS